MRRGHRRRAADKRPHLSLRRSAADAAGHRDDLAGSDHEQTGGRFLASATLDHPERARAHLAAGPDRAASSRSSSTCIIEKSRS